MYLVTFSTVRRPSLTPACDDAEIVLKQHQIGGLLGNVGGAIDRDADIGGMQCGGIVDAVAEKADHAARALQGQQDALLLLRGDAAEEVDRCQAGPQCVLAQLRQLAAR